VLLPLPILELVPPMLELVLLLGLLGVEADEEEDEAEEGCVAVQPMDTEQAE